jgi:hypothetical protein
VWGQTHGVRRYKCSSVAHRLGRSHRGRAADHLQLGRGAWPTPQQPFQKHLRRPLLPQASLHRVKDTGATSAGATPASPLAPHKSQPPLKARRAPGRWHATTASAAGTRASACRWLQTVERARRLQQVDFVEDDGAEL